MEQNSTHLTTDLIEQVDKALEDHFDGKGESSAEDFGQLLHKLVGVCKTLKEEKAGLQHLVDKQVQLEDEFQRVLLESHQREVIISALAECSRAVVQEQDFESVARSIFDSCKNLIGARAGYVALLSEDGKENDVLFLDTGGFVCTVDQTLPMPIRGMREEVYHSRKTQFENDFSDNEWVQYLPDGHVDIKNILFTPLLVNERPVGLLGLANKPDGFNENDIQMASTFGEMAAIALLNSRTLDKVRNSEERFHSVAHTASDAIISITDQGRIIFWNKAAESIFGYTHEEADGKSLALIMPERFRQNHRKGINRFIRTNERHIIGNTVEMIGMRKDGSEFPIELSLSSWTFDGEIFFTGIIRDITERKHAELEIQSLARFPSENRNPVLRASREGILLYANEASQPLLSHWNCQIGQQLPDEWCQLMEDVIESHEIRKINVDCGQAIYSLDMSPVVEENYVTLYGKDVTERLNAELRLRDQNKFITTVFESLSHPFYVIDVNDFTVKMANSAGYPNELPDKGYCYRLIHNRESPCGGRGGLCPIHEIISTKRPVITEHVHYDALGNNKTIEVHAYPIFDDQGEITQVIEYTLDISERKQMELALRESEAKWRSLTEDSPDHIMALDRDANIIFINHSMHGLSKDQVINTSFYDFAIQEYKEVAQECFERVLHSGISEKFESVLEDENCELRDIESHVGPVRSSGKIIGLIVRSTDVTERKVIDEALRDRTHALGERVKELNCLYRISALVEQPGMSINEIFQGTLEIIPPAWQYPEITEARILIGDQEYKTENFDEDLPWLQAAEIKVHNEGCGRVEVCYLEEKDTSDEGPFLIEERDLINAIAGCLGRIVERFEAVDALQKAHQELEQRVLERTEELEQTNELLQIEIIERKRAYEAEQNAHQVADTLRAASQALTLTLDMNTVLTTLLDYLENLVPFDRANIALLGDEACLTVRVLRGYDNETRAREIIGHSYDIEDNPHIHDLLSSGESLLVPDLHQDEFWKPYLDLDQAESWLGIPLVAEEKVIGLCGLDHNEGGAFTREHLNLAETLVGQATVAIQNAWLFEQVRAGRERLQSLSRRLVEIQESERRYISRELHDEAGQALTSLKLGLHLLERDANQPEAIIAGVVELKTMADEILEDLHRLAMDLRPASLDYLGLVAALRQYVEAISDKHGLTVQFETLGFNERLPLDIETALYRIVQEAMTNVIRHSGATRADVILEKRHDKLIIIVEDNGVGFDPSTLVNGKRLGIVGMQERAEMLGGDFTVERSARSGTTVLVEVPYGESGSNRR